MGVIRNNFNNFENSGAGAGAVGGGDDDWIYISSDGEESFVGQNDSISNQTAAGRSKTPKSKKSPTKPEPTFAALGAKGKSHKKFRRYANANLLNDLGNLINESELDDELSIDDFIPSSSSPSSFTLLMDSCTNQLFNLNDFINCTEDEQSMLLDRVIEFELTKLRNNKRHSSMTNDDKHLDLDDDDDDDVVKEEDSNLCFSRISPTIRKQLLKKHVPLGILASIEQKVINHFRHHPRSLYKTALQCSYQRFLLHACCQYLNLNCRSSTTNGKRLSCVNNGRLQFIQPSKLLSEHLDLSQKL
ncbi:R3H domain-containing protein 4 [Dermatophagoides farinae]|uniref:R3H domain containing 4 n=1 Tax=Dermatophagoides farinae TaxID=6954 RepID=A0A922IBL2_DERFA|nr:R3H domain-containing protein 4-like [Dermatophagoides farinae]KAH7640811.1 r3h domain-containing protein 4-like [Dermatophagoides farinae]KAH9526379.1 R3H domain containing 4 [Dermatophagoides farinae]